MLVEKEGKLAHCLNLVFNCEVGDRKIVSETITRIGVKDGTIPEFYMGAMSNTSQIEKNITKIKEIFESFDFKSPKSQILES